MNPKQALRVLARHALGETVPPDRLTDALEVASYAGAGMCLDCDCDHDPNAPGADPDDGCCCGRIGGPHITHQPHVLRLE